MTKLYIDENIRNLIEDILTKNGINETIKDRAKLMDVDLVRLFYEKIMCENNLSKLNENKSVISKMLLGIYGNYIASYYYEKLGYKVECEYPIYDKENKLLTNADLKIEDELGNISFVEVKATSQIIDNIRNYKSEDEEKYNGNCYYDLDSDIIKYKEIATKLIRQVKRLKSTNKDAVVVIFDGCFMDDIVKNKLDLLNAKTVTLSPNINGLENYLKQIVDQISFEIKENKMGKKMAS